MTKDEAKRRIRTKWLRLSPEQRHGDEGLLAYRLMEGIDFQCADNRFQTVKTWIGEFRRGYLSDEPST